MRTEQDRKGPYYWGVLKDGTVRLFDSPLPEVGSLLLN